MKENKKIAILLTCHNRRETTLNCLRELYRVEIPKEYQFDTYLVDDGSTDGTGVVVLKEFPDIILIQGSGNLYWNQGMRLAWKTAKNNAEYDFYFLLNDDTILFKNSLKEIFDCFNEAKAKEGKSVIITGACQESVDKEEFSYGGRTENGEVVPNGYLQSCIFINGNVLLVPKVIFNAIGYLSAEYTHCMGDYDYGLQAIKSGYSCYTTKKYIATCLSETNAPSWSNPKVSLRKRWRLMHTPNGLNIKEYNIFRKKFWGNEWIIFTIKAYLKVLFPQLYLKISNKYNSYKV